MASALGCSLFDSMCLEIGRRNVAFEAQQTRIGRLSNRRTPVRSGNFPSALTSAMRSYYRIFVTERPGGSVLSLRPRRPQHKGEFEDLGQLVTNRANENGSARGTPKCCAAQSNVQN